MGDIYTKIEREEKELIIKGFKYYLNIKDYDKRMKLMQEFLQIMQENQNDQINSPTNDISKNISCNN